MKSLNLISHGLAYWLLAGSAALGGDLSYLAGKDVKVETIHGHLWTLHISTVSQPMDDGRVFVKGTATAGNKKSKAEIRGCLLDPSGKTKSTLVLRKEGMDRDFNYQGKFEEKPEPIFHAEFRPGGN